jgi:hypothetical protein
MCCQHSAILRTRHQTVHDESPNGPRWATRQSGIELDDPRLYLDGPRLYSDGPAMPRGADSPIRFCGGND